MKKYNEISKALKSSIPKPEKSRPIIYEILNIRKDKDGRILCPVTISPPSHDTILDGDHTVDIAFVTGITPANPAAKTEAAARIGKVNFEKVDSGRIVITTESYNRFKTLHEYLFLCNYNQSNKDKEHHIAPRKYYFKIVDEVGEKVKRKKVKEEKVKASAFVLGLSVDDTKNLIKAIFDNYERFGNDVDYMKAELYEMAEANPEFVLQLQDKNMVGTFRLLKELEELEILHYNDKLPGYVRFDNKKLIVPVIDATNPKYDAYKFFKGEGGEAQLNVLISERDKKKKDLKK